MSNLLRTKEGAKRYQEYRDAGCLEENGCVLCVAESLADFKHWRIIPNRFPYDLVAKEHHMLIPNRHVIEHELTDEERKELLTLKHEHLEKYDYFIEANDGKKSIPEHFHLHLIVGKSV
jgi:diadenosine tetraphosphate (Ap4A) HIT family hydrolase